MSTKRTIDHGDGFHLPANRLTAITQAEPIDLSPMRFERIEWAGRHVVLDPPLNLEPSLDEETGQLYVLTDETLDIHVYAQTREQLADELAEQLLFYWDAYARESPQRLTPSASRLRESLLARLREDNLAARPEKR